MRMRSLMSVGGKTAFIAWALAWAARLAGFTGWPEDVLLTFFLLGCADLLIALSLTIAWTLRDYLEQRERRQPGGGGHLADGAFRGMSYPGGLSYRPPYWDPGVSSRQAAAGIEAMARALSEPWAPEKRLMPPPPPGIDFPEPVVYARRDRYGIRTPPFPVHFWVLPGQLIDGVRMEHAVMEHHLDSGHDDCPVCDTWRAEHGR